MVKKDLAKIIKFGLIGGLNTVVDFAVFSLFAKVLHMDIYLAQALGYSAGTINSYTINRTWTFGTDQRYLSVAFLKFILLNLTMLLLSIWLLAFFKEQWGFGDYLAKLFATVITMVISFVVNNFMIFRNKA